MRTFGPDESSAAVIDDEWMQTSRFPPVAEHGRVRCERSYAVLHTPQYQAPQFKGSSAKRELPGAYHARTKMTARPGLRRSVMRCAAL
jgi:hypothetical protein